MDKKKHIITLISILVVVVAGAFYGGMQYGARNVQAKFAKDQQGRGGFWGYGSGRNEQGAQGQRGPGANGGMGDFSGGQITAKDDSSITIKTRNGSSQIVFFSPSTTIGKAVQGAASDLSIGQQITINGKTNPDGSLAAQNIQIRPEQN